jgi:hypothetical protein
MPAPASTAPDDAVSCPVPDQEPEACGAITQFRQQVAICWTVHGSSGFAVTPGIDLIARIEAGVGALA